MTTFAALGIPFPLFEADVEEASEYRGLEVCFLCRREHVHCFQPDALLVVCPHCATENELNVKHDTSCHVGGSCASCSGPLPSGKGVVCYTCLRSRRAWMTKDTELGLVRSEDALAGLTFGKPGLRNYDFELVPSADEDGWITARVPSSHLVELILTPTYSTWQGEVWLFCCRAPMIYIGTWTPDMFTQRAPDGNGRTYFDAILQIPDELGDPLWRGGVFDSQVIYVFRCAHCGRLRGNFDFA